MKKIILLIALAVTFLQSCDENDDNGLGNVSEATRAAFVIKYPSAQQVEWEVRNSYRVADFKQEGKDISAWFDNAGDWYMTETDIPFDLLPDAVKSAFRQSEYQSWKIDDVDMIERKEMETVYVVEIEQGQDEMDLYYSHDGILIKSVTDTDSDDDYEGFIPSQPSGIIEEYINKTYPNSRIVDIDIENGTTEVEILDGNVYRELSFNIEGIWMQTKTELHSSQLPVAVLESIKNSQYATYVIDDVDFIQTSSGEWYLVELESGKNEVKIRIDATGVIL
ncbi:PepSY-like domain-containing protein [Parabacteroides bouchesdurhonensis]|uniref:PepSY-like domain-containing protein n=1 Tax=Parabacteroides bouchesdurhonensis TaxID=1936995 RepID=UPI000E4BC525|nr:PepSY-like domain-containing protein [Parabacteroides bouchesdurhonensis]RHJ94210.1 hypothetical protein DW095_04270 [Bacteroides sp. AM07-16]